MEMFHVVCHLAGYCINILMFHAEVVMSMEIVDMHSGTGQYTFLH